MQLDVFHCQHRWRWTRETLNLMGISLRRDHRGSGRGCCTTIVKEEWSQSRISTNHLSERVNLHQIKSDKGPQKRGDTALRPLHYLLLWKHEVVSSEVDDIANLELINEGLDQPQSWNVRGQIYERLLASRRSTEREYFSFLTRCVLLAPHRVGCLAPVTVYGLAVFLHCFVVEMLSQTRRVVHLVLENLQRIMVDLDYAFGRRNTSAGFYMHFGVKIELWREYVYNTSEFQWH